MLNHLMRYAPIARMIRQDAPDGKILEVGSGPKGIRVFFPERGTVGVDVSFENMGDMAVPGFTAVTASAESLPFEDGSFPVVVCVDVLEHVLSGKREKVISELIRVSSGKVYLSFPAKETYERWEKRLAGVYKLCRRELPPWMHEHFEKGLPEEKKIEPYLKDGGRAFESVPNENNAVHFAVMLVDEFLCPGNRLGEIIAPRVWRFKERRLTDNILRVMFWGWRSLAVCLGFGSTVRKIYILEK